MGPAWRLGGSGLLRSFASQVQRGEPLVVGFGILHELDLIGPGRGCPDFEVLALPDHDRLTVQAGELAQHLGNQHAPDLVNVELEGVAEDHAAQNSGVRIGQARGVEVGVDLPEVFPRHDHEAAIKTLGHVCATIQHLSKARRDHQAAFVIEVVLELA